ncbi:MAG: TRCF domain-containing protein, partial [Planctomycetota bacterium]
LLLDPIKNVTEVARKRLKALEQYAMLGAGFKIAMRDLEIRGAGNLLGAEQSGHIAAVGYEMYCRLLDEAVKGLRRERTERPSQTTIEIGVSGMIPRVYIPSETRRLEAYRRLAVAESPDAVDQVLADLTSAYGEPPSATARLVELARLRVASARLGIRAVVVRGPDVVFRTDGPDAVAEALAGAQGPVRVLAPESRDVSTPLHEVYYRPPKAYFEPDTLMRVLERRFLAAPAVSSASGPSDETMVAG